MFQWSKYQTVGSLCDTSISRRETSDRCYTYRINDITKFNYHDVDVNDLANRIVQIGLKCRYQGVKNIAISSVLVRNDNDLNKLIWGVNISLKHLCKVYGFDLYVMIGQERIYYGEMASILQMKVHHFQQLIF